MATPVRFGTEFLINTNTRLDQDESAVTGLADGRFVVTWTDDSAISGDTSGSAVRAQIYNADGSKAGPEFLVNSTTLDIQNQPTITDLDDGRFVASWTDFSSGSVVIRAQVFNANGSKSGTEIVVSAAAGAGGEVDSDITGLAGGRFVVTWTDTNSDTGQFEVYSQVFKSNGDKLGTAELVHQSAGNHSNSTVTTLSDGRFIVMWDDLSNLGANEVKGRIFNANGSPGGNEFVVNTRLPDVQDQPDVAALKGGRFVGVWVDKFEGNFEIRAQLFDDDGLKLGTEIVVNSPTGQTNQSDPAISVLASGQFVVTWTDESLTGGDTSAQAIKGQLFNADGSPSGGEFLVNTKTANTQYQPAITGLADGRFVVSWSDFSATGGDTFGYAVRGQIFDPREKAINLTGTSLADQWVGTRFNDKMSGAGGADTLKGENGADIIDGGNGNDRLVGGNGDDKLTGGIGRDNLTGKNGADDFIFARETEVGIGSTRDVITDFEHLVDEINLRGLVAGGEFIGGAAFEDVAGQVRYTKSTGILQGDIDGDGKVDFEIEIANEAVLTSADFIF